MDPTHYSLDRVGFGIMNFLILLGLWNQGELLAFAAPSELSLIVLCLFVPLTPVFIALKRAVRITETPVDF